MSLKHKSSQMDKEKIYILSKHKWYQMTKMKSCRRRSSSCVQEK